MTTKARPNTTEVINQKTVRMTLQECLELEQVDEYLREIRVQRRMADPQCYESTRPNYGRTLHEVLHLHCLVFERVRQLGVLRPRWDDLIALPDLPVPSP